MYFSHAAYSLDRITRSYIERQNSSEHNKTTTDSTGTEEREKVMGHAKTANWLGSKFVRQVSVNTMSNQKCIKYI